jgi:hypothetical protein
MTVPAAVSAQNSLKAPHIKAMTTVNKAFLKLKMFRLFLCAAQHRYRRSVEVFFTFDWLSVKQRDQNSRNEIQRLEEISGAANAGISSFQASFNC